MRTLATGARISGANRLLPVREIALTEIHTLLGQIRDSASSVDPGSGRIGLDRGPEVAIRLANAIVLLTEGEEGVLQRLADGLDDLIESLEDRTDRLEEPLENREEILRQKFAELEEILEVGRMTMDRLDAELSGLDARN